MAAALIVFVAGLIAGAMNAVAGGGSFVSVTTLIYVGIPSVSANMSSTIALYPGTIASAWAYRRNFGPILDIPVKALFFTTLVGGFGGALLLLLTPSTSFDKILPWLLLLGSLAFAFGGKIAPLTKHYRPKNLFILLAQFVLGVYGGYFGGAVGIMMLAMWSALGLQDIRAMNAIKVVLVAAANTIAVLCFAVAGHVAWRQTAIMLVAAAMGGHLGAHLALRLNPSHIRMAIAVFNFVITGVFFYFRFF
jgi:uncharacterized membrane protein YfcA